jgi:hypothetical protein
MKRLVLYKYGNTPKTVFSGTEEDVSNKIAEMGLEKMYSFYFDKDPLNLGGLFFKIKGKYEYYMVLDDREEKSKKLPETGIDADGDSGWSGGAFCIAFVYSNRGNFVLKGYYREVEQELDSRRNGGLQYFANFTLWHAGQHRSIWRCTGGLALCEPDKSSKWRWTFRKWSTWDKNLRFRRLPKRWVPEIENFIKS